MKATTIRDTSNRTKTKVSSDEITKILISKLYPYSSTISQDSLQSINTTYSTDKTLQTREQPGIHEEPGITTLVHYKRQVIERPYKFVLDPELLDKFNSQFEKLAEQPIKNLHDIINKKNQLVKPAELLKNIVVYL